MADKISVSVCNSVIEKESLSWALVWADCRRWIFIRRHESYPPSAFIDYTIGCSWDGMEET